MKDLTEEKKASLYMRKGIEEFKASRYEAALKFISKSLKIYENFVKSGKLYYEDSLATAFMNRGVMFRYLERFEEAGRDYREAIEIWKKLIDEYSDIFPALLKCYRNLILLGCTEEEFREEAKLASGEVIKLLLDKKSREGREILRDEMIGEILDLIIKYNFFPSEEKKNLEKLSPSPDITFPSEMDGLDIIGEILSAFANHKGFLYICSMADEGLRTLLENKKDEEALWVAKFWSSVLRDWDYSHERKEKVRKTIEGLENKGVKWKFDMDENKGNTENVKCQ